MDVGGTHVKVAGSWRRTPVKIESGRKMTGAQMVKGVLAVTAGWNYDVVTIGYPGPVRAGRLMAEPVNLGGGWRRIDYEKAFGKPVRIVNDAAMQALGSYEGGRMLYLGLGTGLGSAIVDEGRLLPLEIQHLPYRKDETYEDCLGAAGLKKLGKKRWAQHVGIVCELMRHALLCDYIVLGGGNVSKLAKLPPHTRRGSNELAVEGGIRMWSEDPTLISVPRRKRKRVIKR